MVTIPSPITRVLDRADSDTVDQPRPLDPLYGAVDTQVAVATPCEACGCYWVTDPTVVIPRGSVVCGYCGMMRGEVRRDHDITDYTDTTTEDTDDAIKFNWARDGPGFSWSELAEAARHIVRADPTRDFLTEFAAVARRRPYPADCYIRETVAETVADTDGGDA